MPVVADRREREVLTKSRSLTNVENGREGDRPPPPPPILFLSPSLGVRGIVGVAVGVAVGVVVAVVAVVVVVAVIVVIIVL